MVFIILVNKRKINGLKNNQVWLFWLVHKYGGLGKLKILLEKSKKKTNMQ